MSKLCFKTVPVSLYINFSSLILQRHKHKLEIHLEIKRQRNIQEQDVGKGKL